MNIHGRDRTAQPQGQATFEMANLRSSTTGLPFVVFISQKGGAQHDVRVRVAPSPKVRADQMSSYALRPLGTGPQGPGCRRAGLPRRHRPQSGGGQRSARAPASPIMTSKRLEPAWPATAMLEILADAAASIILTQGGFDQADPA